MDMKSALRNQPAEIDPFELPVHPAATVFPMLPPDELQELAEDIRANGLRESIVAQRVNGEAVLLDGRNRRAACQIVGITLALKWLEPDEDPIRFIYSLNVKRRHLTKGQRAMATAKLYPNGQQGKRTSSKIEEFATGYISMARAVLKHAPDLVDGVLSGATPLDAAYKKAVEQRDQSNPDRAQRKKQRSPKEAKPNASSSPDDVKAVGSKAPKWDTVLAWLGKGNPIPDEVSKALGGNTKHRLTKEQRLDAAIQAEVEKRAQERYNELKPKLERGLAELAKDLEQADTRKKFYDMMVRKIQEAFSIDNCRLIRSCLHPDRESPAERKHKAFLAFDGFMSALEKLYLKPSPLESRRGKKSKDTVEPGHKQDTSNLSTVLCKRPIDSL